MADVAVPSVSAVTPVSADTVLGIQGGTVKRFAVSDLASLGNFTQAGSGAITRTAQAKLRDIVHASDFGCTPGASSATVISGLQAAIATDAKKIRLAGGTYDLGALSASSTLFDLSSKTKLTLVADGAVTFTCTWAANGTTPVIFSLASVDAVRFQGAWKFTDTTGYDGGSITGVKAFQVGDTCTALMFDDLEFTGLVGGMMIAGTADSRSVKGIRLPRVKATGCYYVLNPQANGDDIEANIEATNCRREYFAYAVRNHRIKLKIIDKNIGNASKLASYEVHSNKTEDIKLDIECIWSGAPTKCFFELSHAPTTAGGVSAGLRNIDITFNVFAGSAWAATTAGAIELTAAVNSGADITSNLNCVTDKITIHGNTNGYYVYDVYSRYTLTAGLSKGEAFWPVHAKLNLDALKVLHRTKTFSWTPTFATWAIGNGSTEGNYTIHNEGDSLTVWGKITFGTTSTFGGGSGISIELPTLTYQSAGEGSFNSGHPSTFTMVGMAQLWDSSAGNAGWYTVPVKISGATGSIYLTLHALEGATGGLVTATNPFTWADGDTIQFFAHVVHNNMSSVAP